MLRSVLFCASMLLFGAEGAVAGPFGIDMGAPFANFTVLEDKGGGIVRIAPPPNAHEDFVVYTLTHHKATGVCAVQAYTKEINNGSEADVKTTFAAIKTKIQKLYGQSEDLDFVMPGSSFDPPYRWMRSIEENERVFSSFWRGKDGNALKNDIMNIKLEIRPYGRVEIRYRFRNFDECQKKIRDERLKKL